MDETRGIGGEAGLVDRLSRLATVAGELAAATTVHDVVRVAMNTLDAPDAVPSRALWLQLEPNGDLELVAQEGLPDEALGVFARIPPDSELPGAVAFRDRQTVRSSSRADTAERYPELETAPRTSEGFVALPLYVGQQGLGVFVFGADDDISVTEQTFLEAVAGQVAQALSRIRLTQTAQERARQASRAADRERRRRVQLEFLADLTLTAISAEDHHELMQAVTSKAVPTLGDWCTIHFLPEDGSPMEIVVGHADPDRVMWANGLGHRHPYDPDAETGVAAVIRSGRSEFIADVSAEVVDDAIARSGIADDEARAVLDDLALTSIITVPLLAKRGVIGAMQFVSAESGRHYDEDDVALAEAVAGRVAETLTNHWLTDQHRLISVTLQRSLLPPVLAVVPGLDIAARYWPAGAVSEVGGDFYDVFALADDRWALLIGDACGTGPNAAALTSIARHTVRAAARHGATHPQVIAWLNEAVLLSDRNLFCTACYATIERQPGSRAWKLQTTPAGHPLPVHRPVGGPSRALGRAGTLLGTFDTVKNHTTATTLEPGDVVVFYTDGVTDLPPPAGLSAEGMNALVDTFPVGADAGTIADALHRSVIDRVADPQRHDDIAVLVVRVTDQPD